MIGKLLIAISLYASSILVLREPTKAERRWAHEYLDACEPSSPDWQICAAYIRGYLGAVEHAVQNKRMGNPFCLPDGISTEEVARTFRESTANTHFSFLAMKEALDIALGVKFPCKVS
jgi:hypothetical protein